MSDPTQPHAQPAPKEPGFWSRLGFELFAMIIGGLLMSVVFFIFSDFIFATRFSDEEMEGAFFWTAADSGGRARWYRP